MSTLQTVDTTRYQQRLPNGNCQFQIGQLTQDAEQLLRQEKTADFKKTAKIVHQAIAEYLACAKYNNTTSRNVEKFEDLLGKLDQKYNITWGPLAKTLGVTGLVGAAATALHYGYSKLPSVVVKTPLLGHAINATVSFADSFANQTSTYWTKVAPTGANWPQILFYTGAGIVTAVALWAANKYAKQPEKQQQS